MGKKRAEALLNQDMKNNMALSHSKNNHIDTGDIRPMPQRGSPPAKLNNDQLATLVEIREKNNDATIEELRKLLHALKGMKVDKITMARI